MTPWKWLRVLSSTTTPALIEMLNLRLTGLSTVLKTIPQSGAGSPEGGVAGSIGSLYVRTDGGAGTTLYVKESGANTLTGWVAK